MQAKQKLLVMVSELKVQESIYRDAHTRLLDAHKKFDEDVRNLYKVCVWKMPSLLPQ